MKDSAAANKHRAESAFLTGLRPLMLLLWGCFFTACKEEKVNANVSYDGPVAEVRDIEMVFSDSARKVVVMKTPLQYELITGDRVYPEPVDLTFYDKAGSITTTLRSDSARHIRAQNLFRVMGHVRVVNRVLNYTMDTDELIWNPDTRRIYTSPTQPVDIQLPNGRFKGRGFAAPQDFSSYQLGTLRDSQIQVQDLPD
jgi:LPS export ABC transporter protein LptC